MDTALGRDLEVASRCGRVWSSRSSNCPVLAANKRDCERVDTAWRRRVVWYGCSGTGCRWDEVRSQSCRQWQDVQRMRGGECSVQSSVLGLVIECLVKGMLASLRGARSSAKTSNMLDWDEQGTGDSCRILTDEGPRDDSLLSRPAAEDGSPN